MTGLWLRHNVRRDYEARRRLPAERDKAAAEAVLIAAFELAMRRLFGDTPDDQAVAAFVTHLVRKYKIERYRPIDGEAVVRAATGESVPISDLDFRTVMMTRMMGTMEGLEQLDLSDRDLDGILNQAEQIARDRGFVPDLA